MYLYGPVAAKEILMSGILILFALVVGLVVAVGVWMYARGSKRGSGKVRPDAPPTPEEEREAEPPAGSS